MEYYLDVIYIKLDMKVNGQTLFNKTIAKTNNYIKNILILKIL